jgi:hypothetical protein
MSASFLIEQYRYLFRSFPQRKKLWHKLYLAYELSNLPVKYARLSTALSRPAPTPNCDGRKCVVVLLSHNRPQNLQILVRGALQNRFVSKVVVSNSNPKFRIADWVRVRDPRLRLFDESKKTLPGRRFELADQEDGGYFLCIDDDIFLTPTQWAKLFMCLLQDESVPHGITGHIYDRAATFSNGSHFHHFEFVEKEVDVLIGAYAFTRNHLREVFALAQALEMGPLSGVVNGEDILLSFAGAGRSRIHDIGRPLLCASTSLPGIALWKTREVFWEERERLYERIRGARYA